ncbi:hypothetical protein N7452_000639 [Penicillium brevicompactum]|uniref:3'-5' exonuclease domain-containing protein n=1 Tax=Penicillium brevicompactum TaxID=5074 RepID=A0A9W9R120_PENBR|nr:hypothetical protein N7452_000639 [Penicillium brevicompactum]
MRSTPITGQAHTSCQLSGTVEPDDLASLTAAFQGSAIQEKAAIQLVDTCEGLDELITNLVDLPSSPPSLYIDLEGINLSRHGKISILQIYVLPTKSTYLIDIYRLGDQAFSHAAADGMTLRRILESSLIPKVFFDVRNDSDALYSHFSIALSGVQDLQLMELAARRSSRRLVRGLGKCIEYDTPMNDSQKASWKATKQTGLKLFAPEFGGSYEVFNVRPMSDEIRQYCAQDVQFLPMLWQRYNREMTPTWSAKVQLEVENRVRLSQSVTFNGKGRHMALGPAGWS